MALQNPYSWVFVTGISLALFGIYQLGSALMEQPVSGPGVAEGALMLIGGIVLTPVGLWVWSHR